MHQVVKEVEKINSKDNFIKLIDKYQNLVFSVCLKFTGDYFAAEDLTQETFLSAYQHWQEFDGQSEKAWLCRIAGNKCIDYRREAARRMVPTLDEEMPEKQSGQEDGPLQKILNREAVRELERCCEVLESPYRETAKAYFLEGKTAKEISENTGDGLKTVQTRIYRARELLKKCYGRERLTG